MLTTKKSLLALAMVASVFTGCKTAQQRDAYDMNGDVDFTALFPGYGSDRTDISAGRSLASTGSLLQDALSIFGGAKAYKLVGEEFKTVVVNGVERSAGDQFLAFINRKPDLKLAIFNQMSEAEKATYKLKTYNDVKIGYENAKLLGKLPPDIEARTLAEFMSKQAIEDTPAMKAFTENAKKEINKLSAGKTTQQGDRERVMAMIEKNRLVKSQTGQAYVNTKMAEFANSKEAKAMSPMALDNALTTLEAQLKDEVVSNKHLADTDVRKLIQDTRMEAGRIWELSGESHLIPQTCENFDVQSLQSYHDLLKDIRTELETYATVDGRTASGRDIKRVKCKNTPEITAFVVARFQQKLGREGISAWTATAEMGSPCNFIDARTMKAAKKAASTNQPPDRKIACE